MKTVSVIVPVYNLEKFITPCVKCFLNQTFEDFELIFIDDGSDDKTVEILKSFSDKRIKIFERKRLNAGAQRNFGLEQSEGRWVLFFDGDDFCRFDFLQKVICAAEKFNPDILIFGAREFSEKKKRFYQNKILSLEFLEEKFFNGSFALSEIKKGEILSLAAPWNKIYRREFLIKGGFKFQEIQSSNDTKFFYETIFGAKKISFLKENLVISRRGRENSLQTKAPLLWKNYFLSYEEADKIALKYEDFNLFKIPYFDRKMGVYKHFYKKVPLWDKISFLLKVKEEIKKGNEILEEKRFSIFKILF